MTSKEMTENQREESNLYSRWKNSKEKKILEEYAGRAIEEVPEEYREKIAKLRSYGLGKEERTTYEQVIDFLNMHNSKLMRGSIGIGRKAIKKK